MSIWSILVAVLLLGFLILAHEFGHFIFAKKAKIGVIEFSLGMGPRIFSITRGETMYSLKAIPFGGSCAMEGEDTESDSEASFQKKPVWDRILVVFGGPLFNFLAAIILGTVICFVMGINPPLVYNVTRDSGAEKAGLQIGDEIKELNGASIHIGKDIYLEDISDPLDGSMVELVFERDGEEHEITFDPSYSVCLFGFRYYSDEEPAVITEVSDGGAMDKAGLMSGDLLISIDGEEVKTGRDVYGHFENRDNADDSPVLFEYERNGVRHEAEVTPVLTKGYELGFDAVYYRKSGGFAETIAAGFDEVRFAAKSVFASLKMLFTGQAGLSDMSGPLGIVTVVDDTIEATKDSGFETVLMNLFNLTVLISTNLGLVNLFPLPALDGGRLVFLIIEAITGKRVPPEKENIVHLVGFVLLMVLMVVILFSDVIKLFN